jgi:ribonuclease HI
MKEIYTDGSCLGNPGRGGWGFIVYDEDNEIFKQSGKELQSTNNIMELTAMDKALTYVKDNSGYYTIFTDSNYVKQGMTIWIHNWKKKGFKTAVGNEVKNKCLWIDIDDKYQVLKDKIKIEWVRAHNGNTRNENVDKLARAQAEML